MHYTKYNKQSVGSILLHSDRGIDSKDTRTHSNTDIDPSRTCLNYDLKKRDEDQNGHAITAYAYYKHLIDDISAATKERTGKNIRKDAVTLCSWVITAPETLSDDKYDDFFRVCYSWLSARYGEDNVVTAAIHMDETRPHMHFQFVPIISDKGANGDIISQRLCAKDIETRKTLKTIHQQLQKHLESELGCKVELLNGATEGGNKTITELKTAREQEKLAALSAETSKLTQERSTRQEQIDALSATRMALQDKIDEYGSILQRAESELAERTIDPSTSKLTLNKKNVVVPLSDLQQLCDGYDQQQEQIKAAHVMTAACQAKEQELADWQRSLSEKEKELDERSLDVEETERSLSEREQALSAKENSSDHQRLIARIRSLEDQNSDLNNARKRVQCDLEREQQAHRQTEAANEQLESKIRISEGKILDLETKNEDLVQSVTDLNAINSKQSEEITAKEHQIQKMSLELKAKDTFISFLSSLIYRAQAKLKGLYELITENITDRIQDLQGDRSSLRSFLALSRQNFPRETEEAEKTVWPTVEERTAQMVHWAEAAAEMAMEQMERHDRER